MPSIQGSKMPPVSDFGMPSMGFTCEAMIKIASASQNHAILSHFQTIEGRWLMPQIPLKMSVTKVDKTKVEAQKPSLEHGSSCSFERLQRLAKRLKR